MRDVIEQYPDSEYAPSAMLKFDLAFDHLAAKEMEIGRYYLKRGNYTAAINRFRVVVEDYQTTTPHARGAAAAGRVPIWRLASPTRRRRRGRSWATTTSPARSTTTPIRLLTGAGAERRGAGATAG